MKSPVFSSLFSNVSLIALAVSSAVSANQMTTKTNDIASSEKHATEKKSADIEVIEVHGTRAELPLAELTGSTALVSERDIERLIATQLSDLFRTEPGVSITGYSGRPQNITIRGMAGNRVLVLKDGTRLADGFGADDINDYVGRFHFDLDEVKSIEVAKGPASTFFGSGALAGVVSVKTKQAFDYIENNDHYLNTKLIYNGANQEQKASVTAATGAETGLGDLALLIRASYWQADEQQNFNETRPNLDISGRSIGVNGQWQTDAGILTINSDWLTQDTDTTAIAGASSIAQPDGAWLIERSLTAETQESFNHMLTWQSARSSALYDDWTGKVYWRKTEHENLSHLLLSRIFNDVQKRYRQIFNDDKFIQESYGLQLDAAKDIAEHQLLYGMSYEQLDHQRPRVRTTVENGQQDIDIRAPFNRAETRLFSAYIADKLALSETMSLRLGLRYDDNELSPNNSQLANNSSSEVSANVSLEHDNQRGQKLSLAYAQGYRAAPYDKVYGNIPHLFAFPPFEIIANENLKAETSESIELGASWQFDALTFSTSAYYTRFDDFIAVVVLGLRPSDGVLERQYSNIDEAYTYGFESAMSYQFNSALSADVNLAWMDGKNKTDNEPLRTITPLSANLAINYQWQDLTLTTLAHGEAAMNKVPQCQNQFTGFLGDCRKSNGWFNLDLLAEYQVTADLNINLSVRNLFDRQYSRYQDLAGLLPNSNIDVSQPGRHLSAAIRYQF